MLHFHASFHLFLGVLGLDKSWKKAFCVTEFTDFLRKFSFKRLYVRVRELLQKTDFLTPWFTINSLKLVDSKKHFFQFFGLLPD